MVRFRDLEASDNFWEFLLRCQLENSTSRLNGPLSTGTTANPRSKSNRRLSAVDFTVSVTGIP